MNPYKEILRKFFWEFMEMGDIYGLLRYLGLSA